MFSNSVAKALQLYRQHRVPGLENCETTIQFCQRINDMFDALNRKVPNEGVTTTGSDIEILKTSLRWLNEWECYYQKGFIKENQFLSKNTAEGLRVTLQGVIDMCTYMEKEFQFKYLLTGKLNQDALEKFFGIIREADGSNDHPSTPTFLQLYKLLSSYSILKPPAYDNCTVTEKGAPKILVTISDLRDIYEPEKVNRVKEIKEKLNSLIEHEDWEADEILEHDYTLAPVADCVIYYVTGYLCKQLKKYTKCEICRSAILNPVSYSTVPSAQLVNLKSLGRLIHPNNNFFNMIQTLESYFNKNINSSYVYNETLDDMFANYSFSFPCTEHADEVLSYTINYYLRMRMRQFSQQHTNCKHEKKVLKNENKQNFIIIKI